MKKNSALKAILIVSAAGILFSGYLSFSELLAKTCPLGGCTNLLGLPACVYGLAMYIVLFVIAIIGLKSKK